ncbi:MAG: hypothetical protein ACRDZ4_19370 [Egibacteraceae bacterium]
MIVDCHCHAGKGDGFTGPWDTEAWVEPIWSGARRAGIDRTVVFPVFSSEYGAANARLARIVDAYPRELIGSPPCIPSGMLGASRRWSAALSSSTGSVG